MVPAGSVAGMDILFRCDAHKVPVPKFLQALAIGFGMPEAGICFDHAPPKRPFPALIGFDVVYPAEVVLEKNAVLVFLALKYEVSAMGLAVCFQEIVRRQIKPVGDAIDFISADVYIAGTTATISAARTGEFIG